MQYLENNMYLKNLEECVMPVNMIFLLNKGSKFVTN